MKFDYLENVLVAQLDKEVLDYFTMMGTSLEAKTAEISADSRYVFAHFYRDGIGLGSATRINSVPAVIDLEMLRYQEK